jgi:hypothetical protein
VAMRKTVSGEDAAVLKANSRSLPKQASWRAP